VKTIVIPLLLAAVVLVTVPWVIVRWSDGVTWLHMPVGPARWLGVLAAGFGVYLYVWSLTRLLRRGTSALPGERPTYLETSGWYGRVRHPLLLGVVLILLGEALASASLALLAFAGAYWLWLHAFLVFKEEPDLHEAFGERYSTYAARVPRWIPLIRAR